MQRSNLVVVLVAGSLLAAAVPGLAGVGGAAESSDAPVCAGVVQTAPDGLTVVSVQGMRFSSNESLHGKTRARLVAFRPNGSIAWVHRSAEKFDVTWSYDVDPLPGGTLFVTATAGGGTIVYELDPETGEAIWKETIPGHDTHDADLLPNGNIVVANMRNYDDEADVNRDRVYVYNRSTDEVVWEWEFERYFDRPSGGNYTKDWTHVNDVDVVGEDRLLLSPRNFDQVLLLNRTSGEVVWHLGEDDEHDTLYEQHNPDYLESESGTETVLVADSENDRIVEYTRDGDGWSRTWTLGGGGIFGGESPLDWPRDADRLANGNTLVSDSQNSRVLEVTPAGEVVWEVYAPWLVYDAARIPDGEHGGPTITDRGAGGDTSLKNADPPSAETLEQCAAAIDGHENAQWQTGNETGGAETASSSVTVETTAETTAATAETTAAEGDDAESNDAESDDAESERVADNVVAPSTTAPAGFTALGAIVALLLGWWRYG
jgi:hypothetical protein